MTRSRPHPRATLALLFLLAVTGLPLTGLEACSDAAGASGSTGAAAGHEVLGEREVAREVRDLVTAVTPLAASVPVGEQTAWVERRKDTLERLRRAGPEVGRAVLDAYLERQDASTDVREGLLDVAAHVLPEETRPVLVELVTTYGPPLSLRKKACRLLGQTSPETAIEVIGPILMDPETPGTHPAADQLLYSWLDAMKTLGRDPSDGLANVVVDQRQPQEARHTAAKELGKYPGVRGRKALEAVVQESSGNHYLRRKALQALRDTVPEEEFCAYLQTVATNEADLQFQIFIADMIDDNCR